MYKTICFRHYCQEELSYYWPPNHQLYHGFAPVQLKLSKALTAIGSPVCFVVLGLLFFHLIGNHIGAGWTNKQCFWFTLTKISFLLGFLQQVPPVALGDASLQAGTSVPHCLPTHSGTNPTTCPSKGIHWFLPFPYSAGPITGRQSAKYTPKSHREKIKVRFETWCLVFLSITDRLVE